MIALRLLSAKVPQRFSRQVREFSRLLPALSKAIGAAHWRIKRRCAGRSLHFDIQLVTDAQIAKLNLAYRSKNGVTDVLSFSYIEGPHPVFAHETAGEIYISLPQAARQAKTEGHSLAHELAVLATHGALHLMGYDHEKNSVEERRMSLVETRILDALVEHGIKAKGLTLR